MKNPPFPQNKTFSFAENLPKHPSKATLFRIPKAFHLHTPFFAVLKRHPILQTKSFSFVQTFLYCHPKQPFSALHLPFAPSHNLLSAKEHGCSFNLRSNSLRCNARTSHRFKAFSPPFCAKNRVRHMPPESFAEIFFDRALNRGRRTESRVLFGYFLHAAKSDNPFSLAGSSEVLQTSIQLAAMAASHEQN